jgi:hypothetical protein
VCIYISNGLAIRKGLNFIAEMTANKNVGYVNPFKRHDKPYINGKVMRVNFWLDLTQMGHDMAHTVIIDTASFCEILLHDTWPTPKLSRQEETNASDC